MSYPARAEGLGKYDEATCWPWVAICKALGRIPGGWAVLDPVTEWSMSCNTPLWPLLGLMVRRTGPIRSIGWSCRSLAYLLPSKRIIQSALAEQLLCFDLLTRPKMPFRVMHRKKVTHSNGSYERKSRGRKLADEMGRGKKNPIILS